ncbi:hypothetical protein [Streptomyces sp. LaBMicrA B280]|uniref:hypothetical protein n=1 Tax=Streptomyces sp. LaBMicrA B280 TaxID=3391001 RepID=UPI003BA7ABA9
MGESDMGERDGDDGPPGDRRDTGGGAASAVESHLGPALRAYAPDPEAEHRALAAFRTAYASTNHPLRTRPRDDWRPASIVGGAAQTTRKSGENGAHSKRGGRKK